MDGIRRPEDLFMFCVKEFGGSRWRCGICQQYANSGRNHVRNHVESIHFKAKSNIFVNRS